MAANETGLLAVETAYYDEHTEQLLLTYPNRFFVDQWRHGHWRL